MEVWKDIPGYRGYYQASNLGRVRRIKPYRNTQIGRVLKPKVHKQGYISYNLSKDNRAKTTLGHKLVMLAFVGKPPVGHEINHKNGCKSDNRLENLEYVTASQNIKHCLNVLGIQRQRGENSSNATLKDSDIPKIFKLRETGMSYAKIGHIFGVGGSAIMKVIKRKTWRHIDIG